MAHLSPCPSFPSLQANRIMSGDLRWGAFFSNPSSLRLGRQCPTEAGGWSRCGLPQCLPGTPAVTLIAEDSRITCSFSPQARGSFIRPLDNPFNVPYNVPSCTPQLIRRPQTLSSVTRATSSRSLHNHPILEPARRGENRGEMSYQVEAVLSNLMSLPPRGSMARCMDSFKGKISMQASRTDSVLMRMRELQNECFRTPNTPKHGRMIVSGNCVRVL